MNDPIISLAVRSSDVLDSLGHLLARGCELLAAGRIVATRSIRDERYP